MINILRGEDLQICHIVGQWCDLNLCNLETRLQIETLKLDGCIVWNAHNTVFGEEARLIYIVPACYIKTGRYGKT